jgi:hypothetical protein
MDKQDHGRESPGASINALVNYFCRMLDLASHPARPVIKAARQRGSGTYGAAAGKIRNVSAGLYY